MYSETYRTKSGRTLHRPIAEYMDEVHELTESNNGFCLGCGEEQGCVEPDARKYTCESCREELVYGYEELMIMGLLKIEAGEDE